MPGPRTAGAKYIGRNRPPRVQIEIDVQGSDGPKTISIPFVVGVMADLSGASASDLPEVSERRAVEIEGDKFDSVLKAQKPQVRFPVPNVMTDAGGDVSVDITFESLDDFSPAAVVRKVEPLRRIMETREKLQNLKLWSDGDPGLRKALEGLINDPAQLNALMSAPPPTNDKPEA